MDHKENIFPNTEDSVRHRSTMLGERDTTFNEEVIKYCREHNIYDTDKIGEVYLIAGHFLYWQSHKSAEWTEEDEKMFGSIRSTLSMYINNPSLPEEIRDIHEEELKWFDALYDRGVS